MNQTLLPEWHSKIKPNSTKLIVVDMQKLFLTELRSPWMSKKLLKIIPKIEKIINCVGTNNTIFTRFNPPKKWQNEQGSWKSYYKLNKNITTSVLGIEPLEIVENFEQYIHESSIANRKKSASIFMDGNFSQMVKKQKSQVLVFTGIETDYCVIASVLDAIHLGYHVIVVMDACASSKKHGQEFAKGIFERFPEQLWIVNTEKFIKYTSK